MDGVTKAASKLTIEDPKPIVINGIGVKPSKEMTKEEKKTNEVKFSLIEATNQEVIENPGHYTCPNFRYINKKSELKERLIEDSEVFINPSTHQEIFISEHGIFLYDSHGALIPLTDLAQIRRKEKSGLSLHLSDYMPVHFFPLPKFK